ncbi:MAG: patatin-like phospholipase family protein, partial [Pseudomonadota bacterium]
MANSASGAPAATRGVSKCVNLALQGGGAHGAFSWGVIDALLACPDIEIVGLTGASAGAMNAVALADGLADGDRAVARATLERFWTAVTDAARASPIQRTPFDVAANHWSLDRSPAFLFFDLLSRVASPYDLNPLNINPLRDLVAKEIDFDRVRRAKPFVFVSATNVRTGRNKVFDRAELTVDHVMASACLPFLFQAVEIDGAPYWDGGYMGNPPIWPLFDCSPCSDVIVVQINPFHREETPRAARDILDRLNEITFNASLLRELRAYDFVTRLIADGRMEGTGYREAFIHMIADEATLSKLGASSKLNAEPAFIDMLFRNGRSAAEAWLEANFDEGGLGVQLGGGAELGERRLVRDHVDEGLAVA